MNIIRCDVETYSEIDLKKAGAFKYVEHPSFEILLLSYSIDGGPVQSVNIAGGESIPQDIIKGLLSPDVLIGAWNAVFEQLCLSKYLGKEIPISSVRDTMLHAAYLGFPLSLEAAGAALGLAEDKKKLATGKALIRYFSVPCKPTKVNDGRTRNLPEHDPKRYAAYQEYNIQDTVAEMEIADRLSPWPVPDWFQREWELTFIQNKRGVGVDQELINGAMHCYETAQQRLLSEAKTLTALDNPNSVQQLSGWLSDEMKTTITGLDKQNVSNYLALSSNTPASKRVLEIRQELGKSSVKKFQAMKDVVCADGRVRGIIQFCGTHTHRAAGRMIQPQNFPRFAVKQEALARELVKAKDVEMLELLFGSIPDTLSGLLRSALVPFPGNTMAAGDLASIESRVTGWLAGEEWVLEVFRTHGKIYESVASMMFNVPFESITKKSPYRQQGKVAELACSYGGGVGAISAMDFNNEIPEEEKASLVTRWREARPATVALWWALDRAIKDTIQTGRTNTVRCLTVRLESANGLTFFTIEVPSGSKLFYPNPYIATGRFDKPTIFYWGVNQQTRKWEPIQTYGPRCVENVVQKIARDVIYDKITKTEAAGLPIVFSVHDEEIVDVKTENPLALAAQIEEIMSTPVDWAPGLPLGAEAWAGGANGAGNWYQK